MSQAIQHRVVLVGMDGASREQVRAAVAQQPGEVAAVCADLAAARAEASRHPGAAHLFIVQLPTGDDLSALVAFTSALPGQPVVVLLPPGSDLARLLAVQRAGAAQVVPLPLQRDDFARALDCVALQFAPPSVHGQLIALCGVTGGCGATTVALNLACDLAQSAGAARRGNVLLVELVRQMGSLATYLDIAPPLTTYELLTDPSRLTPHRVRQAMTTAAPGLNVLVGPYEEINPGALSPRHVYQLVELCRGLAPTVVLDVPCGFDDLQFETLALADQVVLVGVQTVASIRTLKLIRDTLRRESGVQDQKLVVNRYESNLPGFTADRLAELLRVPQVLTVANDYPSVMAALNYGKPLALATPHSPVLADIHRLAVALSGAPAASAPESADRLTRALLRPTAPAAAPRQLRVLHIEDDAIQQHALALHLATMRDPTCIVTAVAREAEALRVFRPGAFEVVLLDYHLAEGNGLACLKQLRRIDPLVPIIVVSGLIEPQVAADLLEAGADDFLGKENLSSDRLVRSVTAAVARAGAYRQRMAEANTADAARQLVLRQVHQAIGTGPDSELLRSLHELNRATWPAGFRAGQIQRLVDLVCSELGDPTDGHELPRRALLTLFMRLFGPNDEAAP